MPTTPEINDSSTTLLKKILTTLNEGGGGGGGEPGPPGPPGPPGADGDGTAYYGQVSKMTDGTINIATAGTYQSTGLTATLDSESYGIALGTTDTFAIKNTSGETLLFKIYASADIDAGNNKILGVKLALNGNPVDTTECRASTATGSDFAKLVTNWMIELAPNDEVALFVTNHTSTGNITLNRGRIVTSTVGRQGPTGPQGEQGTIGPAGAQGVQGPVGPEGPAGAVGPAGLTWRSAWSSGTAYVTDDAVGYNGASWFCINAVGPSATPPDVDTTNWALLASQGATGPQGPAGAQGPQGPQGPQGVPGTGGGGGGADLQEVWLHTGI